MNDKVLIDTSVWIDYLQKATPSLSEMVDGILLQNKIYVPKIVIAELIQGSHSEREISLIKTFLDTFNIVGENDNTWVKAGELSYSLKKAGKALNLADCYIAVIAREHNCSILTLDKHFKEIRSKIDINLIQFL